MASVSAIKANLEQVLLAKQAELTRVKRADITADPAGDKPVTPSEDTTENSSTEGVHVHQRSVKKPLLPVSIEDNKIIADQAAKIYATREKQIQQACADLDEGKDPHATAAIEQSKCCVIL
jgi:hypothetical protein